MKILVADDDAVSRRLLEVVLTSFGYEVTLVSDGGAAWRALQAADVPPVVVLDWQMPGLSGLELCRKIRQLPLAPYVILLTANSAREHVLEGLASGADDYIMKPFDREALRARIQIGFRIASLQQNLASRVKELEDALANVKRLQGLLPVCAWCRNIRNDQGYWQQIEGYITEHSEARFTHGICPECLKAQREQMKAEKEGG